MINTVVIQGNITADIELKQTPNGINYTRFSVAINKKTSQQETTYFIPVVAWRQTAEFIHKYFRKGSQIAIEGELSQRTYTGDDGAKHNIIEVVARQAHFCGAKNNGSAAPPQPTPQQAAGNNSGAGYNVGNLSEFEEILSDGDVPF